MDKIVELVKTSKSSQEDIEDTIRQALKEVADRGATKLMILVCKDDGRTYETISLKTGSLKYSECVALLEICKSDIMIRMRS